MSVKNWFSDYTAFLIDFEEMSDQDIGRYYLRKYVEVYNTQFRRPPLVDISYSDFLAHAAGGNGGVFEDGFGFAIRASDSQSHDVLNSFDVVLNQFGGAIPNKNAFFSALSGNVSSVSPIGERVVEVYNDVKDGVVDIGGKIKDIAVNTIDQAGTLSKYLVPLIVIVILIFAFNATKKK